MDEIQKILDSSKGQSQTIPPILAELDKYKTGQLPDH